MLPVVIIDETWRCVCEDENGERMKLILRLIISQRVQLSFTFDVNFNNNNEQVCRQFYPKSNKKIYLQNISQ